MCTRIRTSPCAKYERYLVLGLFNSASASHFFNCQPFLPTEEVTCYTLYIITATIATSTTVPYPPGPLFHGVSVQQYCTSGEKGVQVPSQPRSTIYYSPHSAFLPFFLYLLGIPSLYPPRLFPLLTIDTSPALLSSTSLTSRRVSGPLRTYQGPVISIRRRSCAPRHLSTPSPNSLDCISASFSPVRIAS